MKKKADHFKLPQFNRYKKFLEKCKLKKYDGDLVLHEHHIIPRHLCNDSFDVESSSNKISISVEDHIKAHLMLAKCYETGTYENAANLWSARLLSKKSIRSKKVLNEITETYKGELNPFYGKTHTYETRKILAQKSKDNWSGKSYETRYGKSSEVEKQKRKEGVKRHWEKMTDTERQLRAKNISAAVKIHGKKGEDVGTAQPFLVDGVPFGCRKDVERHYGLAFVTIKKRYKVEKITKEQYKQSKLC
jgi:hypothetical protein